MNALEAVDLCRTYGKGALQTQVLANFNLTLAPGEFAALMGPSGSGKSTFLHLAAGLLTADSGTLNIGGTCVTSLTDAAAARFRRRHVGVVFQDFNLIPSLTVAENITLPLCLNHEHPNAERLTALVERLGLQGKESRRPDMLSGGERQRVAIARALFAEPDVVLADEPTGNLDMAGAHNICQLLAELNHTEKSAILLVTHDPVVAATATRVHFLKAGSIAASFATEGSAEVVSRHYLETYR